MEHDRGSHDHQDENSGWFKPRAQWVALAFLAIAGFFLISEHRAHLLGFLPFGILLLCPLLHMFMHGGHGGHNGDRGSASSPHQHNSDEESRK